MGARGSALVVVVSSGAEDGSRGCDFGNDLLLEDADAGGGEIEPDDLGGDEAEFAGAAGAAGAAFHDAVGVLDVTAAGIEHGADFFYEFLGFYRRKIEQGQAGDDGTDGGHGLREGGEQLIQFPRITGDDVGAGKAFAEVLGEGGVVFDGDEPVFAQAAFHERIGDGAGAGAEFEDIAFGVARQPAGHGGAEFGGTGGDGAGALRVDHPLAQEHGRVRQGGDDFFCHVGCQLALGESLVHPGRIAPD